MQYSRINNKKMKSINKQNVMNTIRKFGKISRKDLTKRTKLTTGTITNLTDELLKSKLIQEKGSGESEGGRKPILLELNPRAGYAIGLELNTSQIWCALSDFKGEIIDKLHERVGFIEDRDGVIDSMVACIDEILRRNNVDKAAVFGIGLAVPGPFNDQKGVIVNPPNFRGWHNVPIRDIIEERTGIKTYAEKETQSSVLGEYWFGLGNGYKRIFQANVYEIGIGGGFLVDGNIFHGDRFCSMELGHTVVKIDGRPCICGSRGCLEAQANGLAAVRYARESRSGSGALGGLDEISLDDVVAGAEAGDAVCVMAIEKCAYYLGVSLMNAIGLLAPDAIVFGGDFMAKSRLLFEKTTEHLNSHPYFIHAGEVKKFRASFGIDAGAIGGIATVLNAFSEI